eukprot:scaffold274837_cov14-Prasinocladus_malaysianus.AAC.1
MSGEAFKPLNARWELGAVFMDKRYPGIWTRMICSFWYAVASEHEQCLGNQKLSDNDPCPKQQ